MMPPLLMTDPTDRKNWFRRSQLKLLTALLVRHLESDEDLDGRELPRIHDPCSLPKHLPNSQHCCFVLIPLFVQFRQIPSPVLRQLF